MEAFSLGINSSSPSIPDWEYPYGTRVLGRRLGLPLTGLLIILT